MFNIFKKKTELDKLKEKLTKLQKEAFELSRVDRTASDMKYAEAHKIEKKIDELI